MTQFWVNILFDSNMTEDHPSPFRPGFHHLLTSILRRAFPFSLLIDDWWMACSERNSKERIFILNHWTSQEFQMNVKIWIINRESSLIPTQFAQIPTLFLKSLENSTYKQSPLWICNFRGKLQRYGTINTLVILKRSGKIFSIVKDLQRKLFSEDLINLFYLFLYIILIM